MAQQIIKIQYSPRKQMADFHNNNKRWKVLVCHRRFGKTTTSLNHLQRDAIKIPNSRWAYIAPTYKQAKNIAWDMIKHYSKDIPGINYNESELTVKYPNGSKLTLYGSDNPDSLRGIALWGVIFDEYAQQPSNIFSEIIAPALSDHKGYAIWIGTPKGKNDFYDLFTKAVKDEDWYAIKLKASETGVIDLDELRELKKNMTEDEYNQEFECSFDSAVKGAIYGKEIAEMYEQKRITQVPYDKMLPVFTWWDLGMSDATSILFFQKANGQWRLIDSYSNSGESLDHYAKILKEKNYNYADHYFPHDIKVRELGTGLSRLEVLNNLGIRVKITPNIPIQDGINACRMKMSTLWIDEENNASFLKAITQYQREWNDKLGTFNTNPLHDWTSHYADAFRYWAATRHKLLDQTQVNLQDYLNTRVDNKYSM